MFFVYHLLPRHPVSSRAKAGGTQQKRSRNSREPSKRLGELLGRGPHPRSPRKCFQKTKCGQDVLPLALLRDLCHSDVASRNAPFPDQLYGHRGFFVVMTNAYSRLTDRFASHGQLIFLFPNACDASSSRGSFLGTRLKDQQLFINHTSCTEHPAGTSAAGRCNQSMALCLSLTVGLDTNVVTGC